MSRLPHVAFVLGTRPEMIKTAPVIHELRRRSARVSLFHTGQHYTPALDEVFFRELELPPPDVNLHVGSLPPAQQVAKILVGIAEALEQHRPDFTLVQGDTNSVLGGALAAHKVGVPIAHLEAGLRSDDWNMPEEGNRVLAGRVAAIHLCPTELQAARLAAEGIVRGVHVVGNTVVDASLYYAQRARESSELLKRLELEGRPFALLTLHRPSNVDDPARLAALLGALKSVAEQLKLLVVFPVHPRTRHKLEESGLSHVIGAAPFIPLEPLGYVDLLALLQASRVALTDSGGVQEEACTLKTPCVTLRSNTERPETVGVGANALCDSSDPDVLIDLVEDMIDMPRTWKNPFGDGRASVRIADILLDPDVRRVPSAVE